MVANSARRQVQSPGNLPDRVALTGLAKGIGLTIGEGRVVDDGGFEHIVGDPTAPIVQRT